MRSAVPRLMPRIERARGVDRDLVALEHARRARALLHQIKDPHHEVLAMAEIAAHHLARGDEERAREIFARASELAPMEVIARALGVFQAIFEPPEQV